MVEVTAANLEPWEIFKQWKKIRKGCQLPRTRGNEQKKFRLGEVKSQILGESDS